MKLLLQKAARVSHKSVSEFLLDVGTADTHQALVDLRHFALSDAQWDEFQQVLERPLQGKPRLQNLLSTPGVLGLAQRAWGSQPTLRRDDSQELKGGAVA